MTFPQVNELKEGLGEILLNFGISVPAGGFQRTLIFENHHQGEISVYLANCLVPRDRDIQVVAQKRNYNQSFYQLDYTQATSIVPAVGAGAIVGERFDNTGNGSLLDHSDRSDLSAFKAELNPAQSPALI